VIEKRPRGWYVVLKQHGKPPVTLGGPYSKETAKAKEDGLIKSYQKGEGSDARGL